MCLDWVQSDSRIIEQMFCGVRPNLLVQFNNLKTCNDKMWFLVCSAIEESRHCTYVVCELVFMNGH